MLWDDPKHPTTSVFSVTLWTPGDHFFLVTVTHNVTKKKNRKRIELILSRRPGSLYRTKCRNMNTQQNEELERVVIGVRHFLIFVPSQVVRKLCTRMSWGHSPCSGSDGENCILRICGCPTVYVCSIVIHIPHFTVVQRHTCV